MNDELSRAMPSAATQSARSTTAERFNGITLLDAGRGNTIYS